MGFKEQYGSNLAIIGASQDRESFSNKAVRVYRDLGYNVYPVNPKYNNVEGLKCYKTVLDVPQVDFVSVYMNPNISASIGLVDQLVEKGVKAAILNPGSEDDGLVSKLKESGIEVLMICSIVGVGKDPSKI